MTLKEQLETSGVRYALASFVDLHGVCKAKAVPLAHLEQMLAGSELFTGAALDGVPQEVSDDEVAAVPDPGSMTILPWQPEVAWFASDLHLHGRPFEACSRTILRRQCSAAAAMGYRFNLGIETEFFVLRRDAQGSLVPYSDRDVLDKPAYDVRGLLDNLPWLDELVSAMNRLGWGVYSFDHEDGPGQFETDFDYADALTMADSIMTFRMIVKEIAAMHNVHATFMPKPLEGIQGSGMHLHLSLFKGEDNAFFDASDPYNLSATAKSFMAGLLFHAAEITAVTNQTVNSYKRLVPGFEAPVHMTWARNNRSGLIRVPVPKRGSASATRIEYRSPAPACNPYLAFSVILAAGLKGVREGYELAPEADANLFEMDDTSLAKLGVQQLPQSLNDALRLMEESALVHEALGEHIFDWFLRNKHREWRQYKTQVTPFELKTYLRSI